MTLQQLLTTTSMALLLTAPLALTACDSGSDDESADETTGDGDGDGDGDTGMLRLVHLGVFPGDTGTGVDIFVNGEASGISFEFKQGTPYVELPAGTYDFDIVPAGGTIDDSVLTVAGFELAAGDMWEIVAAGYVAPTDGNAAFTVIPLRENGEGIPAGNTRLNVFHTAALAALTPVDVWVVDANCAPLDPLLQGFEFAGIADGVDIAAGELPLGFDVGQDGTVDACFKVPNLGADALVNAFAVNDDAGNVSILAHLPDGSVAEVTPEP